jgi:hypothetical protein
VREPERNIAKDEAVRVAARNRLDRKERHRLSRRSFSKRSRVQRPFFVLQGRHAGTMLSIELVPPSMSGTMWSRVTGRSARPQ